MLTPNRAPSCSANKQQLLEPGFSNPYHSYNVDPFTTEFIGAIGVARSLSSTACTMYNICCAKHSPRTVA